MTDPKDPNDPSKKKDEEKDTINFRPSTNFKYMKKYCKGKSAGNRAGDDAVAGSSGEVSAERSGGVSAGSSGGVNAGSSGGASAGSSGRVSAGSSAGVSAGSSGGVSAGSSGGVSAGSSAGSGAGCGAGWVVTPIRIGAASSAPREAAAGASSEPPAEKEVYPPLPRGPRPPDPPPRVKEEIQEEEYVSEPVIKQEDEAKERIMCRQFVRGTCTRGSSCIYVHEIIVSQLSDVYTFCRDYQNTKCTFPRCKFVHATVFEKEEFYRTGKLPPRALAHIKDNLAPPPPPPPVQPPSLAMPPPPPPPPSMPCTSMPPPSMHLQSMHPQSMPPPSMPPPSMPPPSMPPPSMRPPSMPPPSMPPPSMAPPQMPSLQIQSLQMPSHQMPSHQMPSHQMPSLQMPSLQMPSLQMASLQMPSLQMPSVQLPRPEAMHIDGLESYLGDAVTPSLLYPGSIGSEHRTVDLLGALAVAAAAAAAHKADFRDNRDQTASYFFDSSLAAPRLNPECVKCQLGNYSLTRQVHIIKVEKLRHSIADYRNKIDILDKKNNWQNALLKAIFSQIEMKKQEQQSQYTLDVRAEDKVLLEKLHMLFSAGGGLASIVDDYAKKSRLLRLLLDTSANVAGASGS